MSPGNGLKGVPINAQVMIQFNEPVDRETLGQVTLSAASGPVQVTSTLTNGNQTLILIPVATLAANTQYTVTVTGVSDLSGNTMSSPFTSTFTTGTSADFTQPAVTGIAPANGAMGVPINAQVMIEFNKPINALTVTNSTFVVSPQGGTPVTGSITVAPDGTSATFTPATPLNPSAPYVVQATNGITDMVGQAITVFQSIFTTLN